MPKHPLDRIVGVSGLLRRHYLDETNYPNNCVKGIFDSSLPTFIKYIFDLKDIKTVEYRTSLPNRFLALANLKYVNVDDVHELNTIFALFGHSEIVIKELCNHVAKTDRTIELLLDVYQDVPILFSLSTASEAALALFYVSSGHFTDDVLAHVLQKLVLFNQTKPER